MWLRDLLPYDMPGASIMSFEPITESSDYGYIPLSYARKTWKLVVMLLSISVVALRSFRGMIFLATLGLILGIAILAVGRMYRRLADTPTTEIYDQAKELVSCLVEKRESTVCHGCLSSPEIWSNAG
jgi:hypothetical protein